MTVVQLEHEGQVYTVRCNREVISQTETRVEFKGGGYVDVSNGFQMVARGASMSVDNSRIRISDATSQTPATGKTVKLDEPVGSTDSTSGDAGVTMTVGEYILYKLRQLFGGS